MRARLPVLPRLAASLSVSLRAFLAAPLLVACADPVDDTGETGPLRPQEGVWSATDFSAVSDTCGWEEAGHAEEADTTFALVADGDSFTLGIPGGQTIRWVCAFDGDTTFACEDDVETTSVDGDGVTFTQGLSGLLSSETLGIARTSFASTCLEDSGCDSAAEAMDMPVPCAFEAEARFAWESPD